MCIIGKEEEEKNIKRELQRKTAKTTAEEHVKFVKQSSNPKTRG